MLFYKNYRHILVSTSCWGSYVNNHFFYSNQTWDHVIAGAIACVILTDESATEKSSEEWHKWSPCVANANPHVPEVVSEDPKWWKKSFNLLKM